MSKNRKGQMATVRFVPAVRAFLLCALIGGSAVGYVLQKNQIFELGQQISARETKLSRLRWENKVRSDRLAALLMPERLTAQVVAAKDLGLRPTQPSQWIWLQDPGAMAASIPPANPREGAPSLAQQQASNGKNRLN